MWLCLWLQQFQESVGPLQKVVVLFHSFSTLQSGVWSQLWLIRHPGLKAQVSANSAQFLSTRHSKACVALPTSVSLVKISAWTLLASFIGCHFFLLQLYLCIADCVSASCFQILSAKSTSSIGLNGHFSIASDSQCGHCLALLCLWCDTSVTLHADILCCEMLCIHIPHSVLAICCNPFRP